MNSLDRILYNVAKPARYTGGEWNGIVKDWDSTAIKAVLCYPDLYDLGMSNLGLGIIYELLNRQSDVLAERVFAPWVDMETAMRRQDIPLFALESKRPVKEFDILGFSLGYELTYTNVLNLLDLAGVPLLARERRSGPLVIAGGTCTVNPEPMADFIDLFFIGEGEETIIEFIDVFRQWKRDGRGEKRELLKAAAGVPGIYVPSFYKVDYREDGAVASFTPEVSEAGPTVARRIVSSLPPPLTNPVVPFIQTTHDRGAIEIQRGCPQGCRFCQAGIIYRPLRRRTPEEVLKATDEIIRNCGYDEISLLSLSTSDYEGIDALINSLAELYRGKSITLSLPSLRLDSFSVKLADSLLGRKKLGLTFAPEAGTERLRRVINKGICEDEVLQAIEMAWERGWGNPKLYFMIGLPTETDEDITGIVELTRKIRNLGRGRMNIKVSASAFVPKPHTPFQWVGQATKQDLLAKHEVLKAGLRRMGVHLSWQDPRASLLEGVLARGDRRLGAVIHRAWKAGCKFDAWSEHFSYDKWQQALAEESLDPRFYSGRERSYDEVLPWAHIDCGVSQAFLWREYQRSKSAKETPTCRYGACTACGLHRWSDSCLGKYEELVTPIS